MTSKILVSLPQEFLEDVDRVAAEEHRSRSELVREALRAYLEMRRVKEMRLKQVVERGISYGESAAWDLASDEALANLERKAEEERGKRIKESLQALAGKGTFADIKDPLEWQRRIRKDRPLPGREE